jgi:hypothetical protein
VDGSAIRLSGRKTIRASRASAIPLILHRERILD